MQARGWGADWLDNCVPDCASGTFASYRANIGVYRPRYVGGYLLFTRMRVAYKGKRPPYRAYRRGYVVFKLQYSSAYDTFYWSIP